MAARGAKLNYRVTRKNNKEQKTRNFGVFTNFLVCFDLLFYENAEFILIRNQNTCEKQKIEVNLKKE